MKNKFLTSLTISLSLLFLAVPKLNAKDIKGTNIPDNFSNFSTITFQESAAGKPLQVPINGKITAAYKNGKNYTVVLECTEAYYWEGNLNKITYEMIFANVANYKKAETVKYGDEIGIIEKNSCIIARSTETDPYLVRLCDHQILKYKNYYYYCPDWLLNESTTFLDYRQVPSLEDHANDYYNRWYSEMTEEDLQQVFYSSLFNYPELDSISTKIVLTEYPEPIEGSIALSMAQQSYFGRNILFYQTPVESNCPYTPYLYWQSGFPEYLKQEYTLGTDLYIYCTFLALDHVNKRLIINVRDFTTKSLEEGYEKRIADIKEIK